METIKIIVKGHYPILIAGACVLFVVAVFFTNTANGGMGIFGTAGSVYEPIIDTEDVSTKGPEFIGNTGMTTDVPIIKYASGARTAGEVLTFKNLLKVQFSDGTEVSGSTENGFAIYLVDIKNSEGNSEMLEMNAEDIENLEEIPASFLYEKENDRLHLHRSGTYTVIVKIYADSGLSAIYEFKLPVEPD